MVILFRAIFHPFYQFVDNFLLGISQAFKLLQAYYFQRRFAVKVKYADHPVIVRGGTSDVSVFYEIFVLKIYPLPEREVISIIDVGANVGYASIYFAHFFPNARIIAVEPEGSNYQTLVENTQNHQNISCVHAPIWPEEIELALQNPEGSNWSFHYGKPANIANAPVIKAQTLPGLMEKFDLQRISLLKIDIEGGEKTLFASDTDWLRHVDCLQIEIHSDEARKTVFNALAGYPHSYVRVFNNYHITLNNSPDPQ